MKKKAVAYLRRSGPTQEGSFHRQQQTISEYALTFNIEIIEWYRETAPGDASLASRDVLRKALARCVSGDANHFLIEDADRLARCFVLSDFIRKLLSQVNVDIHDVYFETGITSDFEKLVKLVENKRLQA